MLEGVARRTLQAMSEITGLKANTVVGMKKADGCWEVVLELVEKESIPRGMDVLGLYRVRVESGGEVLDFERVRLRRRQDVGEHQPFGPG